MRNDVQTSTLERLEHVQEHLTEIRKMVEDECRLKMIKIATIAACRDWENLEAILLKDVLAVLLSRSVKEDEADALIDGMVSFYRFAR